MKVEEVRTRRLRLRRWGDADRQPFAAMNKDPDVMEFFPSALSRRASNAFVDRIEQHFENNGFGLWAVEVIETTEFAGYVGLWSAMFDAHFTPAVEVGWRLGQRFWGYGYATEAARAAVQDGFERLDLDEIVSFTSGINIKSRRVMEKLAMSHDDADDFDHPSLPVGNPLRPHVLYRLRAPSFDH